MRVTFVLKEWDEVGDIGLWFKGRHWADPMGAMAAAHDMMEHRAHDTGTVEEELMAFGAMYWLRGERGFFRNGDWADNAYSEVCDLDRYADSSPEYWRWRDPGKTYRLDEYTEDQFSKLLTLVRKHAVEYKRVDQEVDIPAITEHRELGKIRGWLRRGYRNAQKRYARYPTDAVTWCFHQIQDELDKVLKRYGSPEYEGMEFVVQANLRRGEVKIIEKEPYGYA